MKKSHSHHLVRLMFQKTMMARQIGWMTVFLVLGSCWTVSAKDADSPKDDTCLMAIATCLAEGKGNFFLYQQFSSRSLTLRKGDYLEYDLYLLPSNPEANGAVDVDFDLGSLRESGVTDQTYLSAHGASIVASAVGNWYRRSFSLDNCAGKKTTRWNIAFEGDKKGVYALFVRNVAVKHADGSREFIYRGGTPEVNQTLLNSGYSQSVVFQPMPSKAVTENANASALVGANVPALITDAIARQKCMKRLESIAATVDLAEALLGTIASRSPDQEKAIRQAREVIGGVLAKKTLQEQDVDAAAEKVNALLKPFASTVKQWTGHLFGNAHIDTQWLWEYTETIDIFRQTFAQAVKFMEEYPDFTFSQSSSAFYQGTEAAFPQLFAKIKQYVRQGRWEIVGGRICEGDTNLVSAESHARHFLYGQRYFRERFGKQAVVDFEADTFGHCWQMPQILKLGGCRYYYFCRAGKGLPLFWWQGPDQSRVLAFDGSVLGGWYNNYNENLHKGLLFQLPELTKRSGVKDVLWAYGVGNHGGGPTRENIETAREWMQRPCFPKVKFSTATGFFESLKQYDLGKLPVVKDELNFVFEGCYTTHGNIKRWNNDAQAVMVSAETAAAMASRFGFPYPGLRIRQNWEDICWNQHHDTLDGSSVSGAYKKSKEMLEKVITSGRKIGQDAVDFLATQVNMPADGLLVFNPLGIERDTVVEIVLPENATPRGLSGGGDSSSIQVIDATRRRAIFVAHRLPPVGYRVYRPTTTDARAEAGVNVSADGATLENENLKVVLDANTGMMKSLFDKRTGREVVAAGKTANRLEVHYEKPNGMPAWGIGEIDHVEILDSPVTLKVVENGSVRGAVEFSRSFKESTITQRVSLLAGGDSVVCSLRIDWKEIGSKHPCWPFLKAAFDLNIRQDAAATYEIPFGAIARPINGHEMPALKWVDLSAPDYGMSLINDSKHGYSVLGNTLRLSLVRTPTFPDNTSDNYLQTVQYELYPHQGDWKTAGTVHRAFNFVHPLLSTWATAPGKGRLPLECSFVRPVDERLVITAIKRAEDDDDLIVRLYEPDGIHVASKLNVHWLVESGRLVNFMEDVLAEKPPMAVQGKEVPLDLNGSEIQNVKLCLESEEGIEMKGTRGPGPIRPF